MDGSRSSITIFAGLPAKVAFAYWPIATPALKLSVANNASVASSGSVGESNAMMTMPWSRHFFTLGTMALLSAGVIRIPLAPALIMFSTTVTWPALSLSVLPAPVSSVTPGIFAAAACAPFCMATKNGLVRVLTTRPTFTGASPAAAVVAAAALVVGAAAALVGAVELFFELEHADTRMASATVDPIKATRRR